MSQGLSKNKLADKDVKNGVIEPTDSKERSRHETIKILISIYNNRQDLQQSFPEVHDGKYEGLIGWAIESGLTIDSAKYQLLPHWQTLLDMKSNVKLDEATIKRIKTEVDFLLSPKPYEYFWMKPENLEVLNRRIYNNSPPDKVRERANGYCNTIFNDLFPFAVPGKESRVLEFGSELGWIMEAMLKKFSVTELVGLEISDNMALRARERWRDARARFVVYQGYQLPFPDDYFNSIYSIAAFQRTDKSMAFILMKELYRLLAPKGHAIFYFLSVHGLKSDPGAFTAECLKQIVHDIESPWRYYYSFDELYVLFHDLIGVDELDIRYKDKGYYVYFSKKTGNSFRNAENLIFRER